MCDHGPSSAESSVNGSLSEGMSGGGGGGGYSPNRRALNSIKSLKELGGGGPSTSGTSTASTTSTASSAGAAPPTAALKQNHIYSRHRHQQQILQEASPPPGAVALQEPVVPQVRRKTKFSPETKNNNNTRTPEHYRAVFKAHITESRLLDDRSDDEKCSWSGPAADEDFILYPNPLQHQHHYHQYYREQEVGSGVGGLRRRKYSFPISLLSTASVGPGGRLSSGGGGGGGGGAPGIPRELNQRRRFSSVVTDAVTRKLSTTMGWNRPSPSALNDLVQQGKALCGQFIRWRLKRCGMLPRKCGLQRTGGVVVQVLPQMVALVAELERLHPRLYTGVARQACPSPRGLLTSERLVTLTLTRVATHLMAQGVSWPKIVSLYGVAGGLALDCVVQGHPQFLQAVTEAMELALHQANIASWIFLKGGWSGLQVYCRPPTTGLGVNTALALLGLLIASLLMLALSFRLFGKYAYNSSIAHPSQQPPS